ncbi:MAG: pyridoxal phosphate-dependent aminotransferase [Candidatus Cloacimonetes bacterium]|nr:pyridoxal phosphate-dependent aminotransferase [Candidatus Cloacimonadota bacterium]
MKLSQRAYDVQASPIRKLMPYANSAKQKGIKVYHLNIGQPDIETPQVMMDAYHRFSEKVLGYGPSQGLDEYRQGLAGYYQKCGLKVEADDIIVTVAGSEAIVFAFYVTCNEGDEIIIPEPLYTNYNGFATMAGIKIVPLTTFAENGFALPTKEEIAKLITPRTRAIMLCNPGNPTGTVYTKEELQRVVELAKEHNLFVISDEVYREFVYDGLHHTSILEFTDISDRTMIVDSVSKRYSACGARVGCIVSKNRDLMAAVLKFAQARLCPPTIDQYASNACLELGDDYFTGIIKEYTKRRDLVYAELQKNPEIVCTKPGGAFYIFPKLPVMDAEKFIIWLLSEFEIDGETVMAAPAEGFYATPERGKDELRIAYVLNTDALLKAMNILLTGLERYRKIEE